MLPIAQVAHAGDGRLLATGGATQVEGSAGGGLVPWAVLAGYGTRDEFGGTAYYTQLQLPDYRLDSYGAAFTIDNRVEFSVARDRFDLGTLGKAIGMPGAALRQDILGVKWRLAGDLVYGDLPQISIGAQQKHDLDFTIPQLAGARHASGTDVYIAATRLVLGGAGGYDLLWNVTLRSSNANQFGLLGFGGDRGDRHWLAEGSLAMLFNPNWAVGLEYRQKPDNLSFAREDHAADGFLAWFPNKRLALVAAYVDLGSIAGLDRQRGWYLSLQGSL
ncbi:DUF3034 family protein [Rhodanobacter sp. C03]|uniref:DUF3034 family protein n=1 Tax=Rhodanobacter sp. C03 TaxID=1945858 RepID=UPI000985E2B8|nr:DUF3034 family protein [Rhodanobacter sp. C03]OOG56232.1 hypothetical protein B0E48_08505 [Rhodanobacter sp. C03]